MLISGQEIAKRYMADLAEKIAASGINQTPHLAVILVGDHPSSISYISMKQKACRALGIESKLHHLSEKTSEKELINLIKELNETPDVHGILLQLPLAPHLQQEKFLELISPKKDVDGFHPVNLGRLLIGHHPCFVPCTPLGVYELLRQSNVPIEGADIVIVGRSRVVGMPLAALLSLRHKGNATVTVCHSATKNLNEHCKRADILIAAIGSPHFIKSEAVKKGAVVIDVGINRIDDPSSEKGYRLVGDVDFDNIVSKTRAITPVPGGVGPMTVAMLMHNTWQAFISQCDTF